MSWKRIIQTNIQRTAHEDDPNHNEHSHTEETGVCSGCDQVKPNLTAANFRYYDPSLQTWDYSEPDYYCTNCFEKFKGDLIGEKPEGDWDDYIMDDPDGTPDWQDPDWNR